MPSPLAPSRTIGIIGGGQLGKMTAMAAAQLGYRAHIFSDTADAPALQVTPFHTLAPYTDAEALARFAAQVDVITCEFENIPAASIAILAEQVPVYPHAQLLQTCSHRLQEKQAVQAAGIPTAPYQAIPDLASLRSALAELGTPAILKTCELGYDGKGQWRITPETKLETLWQEVAGLAVILEGFVPFIRELSVIVVRSPDGRMATYGPMENQHRNGILDVSRLPASCSPETAARAIAIGEHLAQALGAVGLLTVELFEVASSYRHAERSEASPHLHGFSQLRDPSPTAQDDSLLLVNELAPRPHNSGHLTIEACYTSQFENLVRAICGLPLGATTLKVARAEMHNLLGDAILHREAYLTDARVSFHDYGKSPPLPGRKMGHITRCG